jgi:DNA-binding MarR family transcriptional regulator
MSSPDDLTRLAGLLTRAVDAPAVVLHLALAERLGLNATDLLGLQLVAEDGETTPGRLAQVAGLTTGAITGILDRLEAARLIERSSDPADRRRVTVRLTDRRLDELLAILQPLADADEALLAERPAAERSAIGEYLGRRSQLARDETSRLRATTRGGFVGNRYQAPLGEATRGRLAFVSGGPRVSMNVAPFGPGASARIIMETAASRLRLDGPCAADELVTCSFDGPLPDVRVAGGDVTVRYRRQPFASRSGVIRLNATIPWTIEINGGITDLLGAPAVSLIGLEVSGGANHIGLDLPEPSGTVAVRVNGVVSNASFRRSATVPVELRVDGGISHLALDDQRASNVSGPRSFISGDFDGTPDRYRIEVLGGASHVTVSGS